jgi:hypothetical protein
MSLTRVAVILGFSASASAGWQGTEWGMSPEEAYKVFRVPKDHEFTYMTGNIVFDHGNFDFDPITGGLDKISMGLRNIEKCEGLFGGYRGTYGNPASDEKKSFDTQSAVHEAIWNDPSHNNKITVSALRNTDDGLIHGCGVIYEPFNLPKPKLTPAPGGL